MTQLKNGNKNRYYDFNLFAKTQHQSETFRMAGVDVIRAKSKQTLTTPSHALCNIKNITQRISYAPSFCVPLVLLLLPLLIRED